MNYVSFIAYVHDQIALPTALVLALVACYLTIKLKFIQIRSIGRFCYLIRYGAHRQTDDIQMKTVSSLHALLTAMSTSLGIGTIIGPSVGIILGGPGALVWLAVYALCSSVTKFAEVAFALHFRRKTHDGSILGGPMAYLSHVHRYLDIWYAAASTLLFAGWSGLQANVLATTLKQEHVPTLLTGIVLACIVLVMLKGGAKKIGEFNSKLVPLMCLIYVCSCIVILYMQRAMLLGAFILAIKGVLQPTAALGGFAGATIWAALRAGIYKGAYITESGMGTAAIAHSLADVEKPTDQAILAMISVFIDTLFCLLSGMLVLTTDLWRTNTISNTLIYNIFEQALGLSGRHILVVTVSLFALGTIIGNSFNGRQSFAYLTRYRFLNAYYVFICVTIIGGSIGDVPLVWHIVDLLLPCVALPNVISIAYLAHRYYFVLNNWR